MPLKWPVGSLLGLPGRRNPFMCKRVFTFFTLPVEKHPGFFFLIRGNSGALFPGKANAETQTSEVRGEQQQRSGGKRRDGAETAGSFLRLGATRPGAAPSVEASVLGAEERWTQAESGAE